ncbi:hypothetical protein [Aliiroseovarius subalbicans]|uniref:hypothetical protein n=1 Tax=Aliiroseovarius subalbicans TaxID=2925840 RepID=UPI001F57FA9A|nr:hypothetical protein [Aliiroseovarius subalbicans]MCI2399526.1 hypothetical protein [Aliiroseovarius subalbicans]
MSTKLIVAVLAVFVVILVVVGGSSGGKPPGSDKVRISDLRDLSGFVRCVAQLNDNTLPTTLTPVERCGRNINLADPATGTPYGYEVLTPDTYRVCAEFEKPKRVTSAWYGLGEFDPETGCATAPLSSDQ